MYAEKEVGTNDICVECKRRAKKKGKELTNGPVPILHVGKNFDNNDKRLLFIGLVAYGWNDKLGNSKENVKKTWEEIHKFNEEVIAKTYTNIEERFRQIFEEKNGSIKVIRAIKQATSQIFGNSQRAYDNIAFTNFVHCNSDSVDDNLLQFVRRSCIDVKKLGLLFKEIEILNPTHVVVLTQTHKYVQFLPKPDYRLLQIKHPSRGNRDEFIRKIKEFYNTTLIPKNEKEVYCK